MGQIKAPPKVKYFCGILLSDESFWGELKEILVSLFGNIQLESSFISFSFTKYYEDEMGSDVKRKFVLFDGLGNPAQLAEIKCETNKIEDSFRGKRGYKRPVNLDTGYIESSKVILASTKNFFHRIYIGNGIFAEVTMHWRKKKWNFFEWTYPDYKSKEYVEFFTEARDIYLKELK